MRISLGMCRSRRGEAVALPNRIRQKRRCMSGVTAIVRTASRHGPRLAVADQCDQTASRDHLRPSRYSFFVAVCMVCLSLSEKSQYCVSVCCVYMQYLLAKLLILHLVLSYGNSLDQSRICGDRIARFAFSSYSPSSVGKPPLPVPYRSARGHHVSCCEHKHTAHARAP